MSVAYQAHFAVEDDAGIKLLLTIAKTTLAPHDILMTLLARQPAAFDMHWLYLACGVSGSECGGKLRQDNYFHYFSSYPCTISHYFYYSHHLSVWVLVLE